MICLNCVIELMFWSSTMSLQVLASTPVESKREVVPGGIFIGAAAMALVHDDEIKKIGGELAVNLFPFLLARDGLIKTQVNLVNFFDLAIGDLVHVLTEGGEVLLNGLVNEDNSLIPPSTQPMRIDGEPYTKEFFDDWWKNAPERIKPVIQHQKMSMVRELEMVLAAAMRVPGMGCGGVIASFNSWAMESIIHLKLEPYYETEWNERIKKAKKKPNKTQADWELVKLFIENKPKFIQEAFEADLSPTPFIAGHLAEKRGEIKNDSAPNWKKKSKPEKLKSIADFATKIAKKLFQAVITANSGPKRTR
jgi:hypothetical protein